MYLIALLVVQDPKRSARTSDHGYSGAVLRTDASKLGRLPVSSSFLLTLRIIVAVTFISFGFNIMIINTIVVDVITFYSENINCLCVLYQSITYECML